METLGLVALRPDDLTWDRALRQFALRCRSQNLTPATQKLYAINLNTWRRWLLANGDPQPPAIRADHIRAFLQSMKDAGRHNNAGVFDQSIPRARRKVRATGCKFVACKEIWFGVVAPALRNPKILSAANLAAKTTALLFEEDPAARRVIQRSLEKSRLN